MNKIPRGLTRQNFDVLRKFEGMNKLCGLTRDSTLFYELMSEILMKTLTLMLIFYIISTTLVSTPHQNVYPNTLVSKCLGIFVRGRNQAKREILISMCTFS
jgi:hypothetical protein